MEPNLKSDNLNLPIACSLTREELSAMRDGLLPGLLARANAKELLTNGFRLRFEPALDLAKEIGTVIDAEHRCCKFLRFLLIVEPGDGPVYLEVTGPEGTRDFLRTLLEAIQEPKESK